jgi:hypothetical protein
VTLRFIDSFDDRDTTYLSEKYSFNSGTIVAGGRNGTQGLDVRIGNKIFTDQATWVVGFAYYLTNDFQVASFLNFLDSWGASQLYFRYNTGVIEAYSGGGGPFIGATVATLTLNAWAYVEVKVVIDNVNGSIEIRFDEVPVYTIAGIDTQTTAQPLAQTIEFPELGNFVIDDLYVCDGSGAMNNDFLGDSRITAILPNGDGTPATAEWDSSGGGASIFSNVNTNPPAGFPDNRNSGVGLPVKDVWAYPNIVAGTDHILGVQVNALARLEDDLSIVNAHNICRSGGADYSSTSYWMVNAPNPYQYYMRIWEQNPDGPINWLLMDFNLAEWGYERENDPSATEMRVTQLSVEILRGGDPEPAPPTPAPVDRRTWETPGGGEAPKTLSISIYQPLVLGGAWIADYTDEITTYQHELGADNWYLSCDFTLNLHNINLDEWMLYGLGRHIEVKAPGQYTVWEGFVNSLTINIGQNVYEIGPLMDIGNRVYVIYTPVYVSAAAGSIVKGTSMESALVNDTASQARYGIIEKCLSAGECIITTAQNEADRFRAEFLLENAYHKIGAQYSFGSGGEPTVQVNCLGYWKWLDAYVYNNRATAAANGYSTLNTKLQVMLTANPNAWSVMADYSRITANTAIAANREKDNRTAMTIVKGITAAGDPAGNRWLFGVGPGRVPYYQPIPIGIDYEYRVYDNEQRLTVYGSDAIVEPWDVKPGRWYLSADVYKPVNYQSNYIVPSASFIETVRYTAPYGLELTEGKLSKISQMLNAKGLGAI